MREPEPTAGPSPARDPNRPRGCTCFRLRRTARQVTRIYDAHLAAAGLTLTQYSLLSNLALGPNPTPSVNQLADVLSMDRTTLTRTLKPLLAARLVALARCADKRSKAVTLTAAGRAAFDAAKPLWRAAQDSMIERLGAPRVTELHRLLDDSFDTLEAAS